MIGVELRTMIWTDNRAERDGCTLEVRPYKDGTFWLVVHKYGRQAKVGVFGAIEAAQYCAEFMPLDDIALEKMRGRPHSAFTEGFAEKAAPG